MNGILERTLGILELLTAQGDAIELSTIAERLDIPPSAVHRLLNDLIRCGYVTQTRGHGDYMLTTKLVSMGLTYLSSTGIVDIGQPLLDQLAATSGELVRLSVLDGDRLTWVARAQGARTGLRYDPDMGNDARFSCSSAGWALMAALPDDEALALVSGQGLGDPAAYGPNAPTSIDAVLKAVKATRKRGYSLTVDTYTAGLSAMAAAVKLQGQPRPLGMVSIAGPSARFTEERMHTLAPELLATCARLAAASGASPFFRSRGVAAGDSGERKAIYAP